VSTRSEILAIVRGEGLRMKRSFGQSFLLDDDVLSRIAARAARNTSGTIIEIGAGLGTLTEHLADRARRVLAIEKDRDLVPLVRERLARRSNVTIVEGDALDLRYADLAGSPGETVRPAIAGNLPYSITSPLLLHLLGQRAEIGPATVMVQREVAERLAAEPGGKEYGSLTVLFRLHAEVERLFDVGPECFHPAPKVHSSVVRIDWLEALRVSVGDRAHFERVVRAAFSKRRKTLRNALSSRFERADVDRAGRAAEIDLGRRAETLTLPEFSRLAASLPRPSESSDPPSDP
jgi:16S rRNA (adenine1518-N6/adenine1519-N6)-dimethyltransferase